MEASSSTHSNNRLRQERIRRNWRQQDVADYLGTTVVTVKRWEKGSQQPSAYFRFKLSALFEKSAEELGLFSAEIPSPVPTEAEVGAPAESLPPPTEGDRSCLWGIPYPRNPFFTGKEEVLHRLHDMLGRKHIMGVTQSVTISGLGGIGKTQTAIEYAYRYASDYAGVFWISAETSESIIASIVALADLLNLPEKQEQEQSRVMSAVTRWLNSHGDWLLIFDNVEDIELVKGILPATRHGCWLLTSRQQALGLTAQTLDLEPMTPAEGMRFLLYRARRLPPTMPLDQLSTEDEARAQQIVLAMDGLPLALDQAGAYIEETGCDFAHYCALYQVYRGRLLDQRGQWGQGHPYSVVTTLALSVQQAEARCPAATDLLRVCAFLAPDAIPEELFLCGTDKGAAPVPSLAFDVIALNEALAILRRYSLLKRQAGSATFSIHRVVQAVLKAQMDQFTYHSWAQKAIQLVNYAFPAVEIFTTWSQCQRLLSHALACAALIEEAHVITEEAGRLLHQTGAYLLECAQYSQAKDCLSRAQAIREQLLGPEHPDVAESLNYEAELAYYQGQYQQAEQLHQRALRMREQQLGPAHPAVATSLHNLAGIYWIQGRYAQAEPLYQRALQLREDAQGSNHLDVAETLQNLAYLYFEQGHYQEAEPLYQRALGICQQVLGPEHAYLITLYNNLGRLYHAQGKYFEAKTCYQHAQALCERTLDAKHPHWAMTLSNLAGLASAEGAWEQAEEWYRQALQIRESVLGPEHPRTAQSLCELAVLYTEQGQNAQAAHLYRQALVIREKTLGRDHSDTVWTREAYTLAYAQLGEADEIPGK